MVILFISRCQILLLILNPDNDLRITPPPPFSQPVLEFDVPCGKFSRDLEIKESTPFFLFLGDVARLMGLLSSSSISIGYILPWKANKSGGKTAPKILDNEEAYEKMKADVAVWRKEQASKNKGKGVVKAFSIQLVDLNDNSAATKVFGMLLYF
jgi:hypothetical protein